MLGRFEADDELTSSTLACRNSYPIFLGALASVVAGLMDVSLRRRRKRIRRMESFDDCRPSANDAKTARVSLKDCAVMEARR